jgi:hypothetical protein
MSSLFMRELRKRNKAHGYIQTATPVARVCRVCDGGASPARPSLGVQGALIFLTQQQKRLTMTNIYDLIKPNS